MTYKEDASLPPPFVQAIKNYGKDYDAPAPHKYSVTSLIDAPIQRAFKAKYTDDIVINPIDEIWALRGSAIHYILEKAGTDYIRELRSEIDFEGYIISGKIDLLDDNLHVLWDYKDTSVWSIIHEPQGKPEHIAQLNINRYILVKNGHIVDKLKLFLLFKDFSDIEKLKIGENYPEKEVAVIDVEIWSEKKVEAYLRERLGLHNLFNTIYTLTGRALNCSPNERWQRKGDWCLKANDSKQAYRRFDTKEELDAFVALKPDIVTKYPIQQRPGEDVRCIKKTYCKIKQWCPHWQNNYQHTKVKETITIKETIYQ